MNGFDRLIGPALLLLFALFAYVLVVRPLLRILGGKPSPKAPPASPPAGLPDEFADLDLTKLKLTDQDRIRRLAQSNPDKARELVQLWIRQGKQGKKR